MNTKKQSAPKSLDHLDPATRTALRKAARQAGMTLDQWLAAAADKASQSKAPRSGQRHRSKKPSHPAPTVLESVQAQVTEAPPISEAALMESTETVALDWADAETTPADPTEPATPAAPGAAQPQIDDIVRLMAHRLDEIERKVGEPKPESALEAIERLEARVSELGEKADEAPAKGLENLLATFEDRLGDIAERIARSAPRPIGRRGFDPRDEVLSAVAEIRSRQRELESADQLPAYSQRFRPAPRPQAGEPALATVQGEIERLRESIAGLATHDEVGAIECSLRDLSFQLADARGPGDLQAMSGPIEDLQNEIRSLAELVTTGLQGKFADDLERLLSKVDHVAGAGMDPQGVNALIGQLSDAKQALTEMAEPRKVQGLVEQVTQLNGQLAEIRTRQVDAYEFASLKSAVEDIRTTLQSPRFASPAPAADFMPEFEKLAQKLDGLSEQASFSKLDVASERLAALASRLEGSDNGRVASRLDEISSKIESFGQPPQEAFARELEKLSRRIEGAMGTHAPSPSMDRVIAKLDRLDDTLRRRPSAELKPLEDLVRSLAEKLDQAGRPGAGLGTLDALESQVFSLAERLESTVGRDPALAPLERSMDDLMKQVGTLRDSQYQARPKVTEPAEPKDPDLEFLKRELAEFDTRSAGGRGQAAPDTLRSTLDTVVSRLTSLEHEVEGSPVSSATEARRNAAPSRLDPGPRAGDQRPDEAEEPLALAQEEILLEPGAGPPRAAAPSGLGAKFDAEQADIKASFIAAARRAAQAAAAEAGGKAKANGRAEDSTLASGLLPASLSGRLKMAIDKRRRPLLLGLAAIILAIGAMQVLGPILEDGRLGLSSDSRHETSAALAPEGVPLPALSSVAPEAPEPRTTQSLAEAPALPAPAQESAPDLPATTASAEPRDKGALAKLPPKAEAKPGEPPRPSSPVQLTTAAPAPLVALPEAPSPAGDRIANVASAGEIPQAGVPAPLRAAALAGEPNAVYELATRLAEGRGVARDPKLAAKLFERAALHGMAPAQYRIGNHYEKGFGVARDLTLAKLWYQRAAEKGNARAMHNLGVLLADGSNGRPDYTGAVNWFRKAAEHGVRDSQFNLGVLLARGLGTAQDLGQSYTWFSVAAAQGDGDSAKKREEVAARMNALDAAAARSAAERWRPATLDKAANEVAPAPSSWSEAPLKRSTSAAPNTGKV